MANSQYNPDVLNCIANLSNDEVFTPPALANEVLDVLPQELFADPRARFLDPFCKSGVFLREIVKRLDRGLAQAMPDRRRRIDHILHNQVHGIALTELTALLSRRTLYCSKSANGPHSVSRFDDEQGNVRYQAIGHTWVGGKCRYCGAGKKVYDRNHEAEQYAYQFIHTDNPQTLFPKDMRFDVIIGNPPYQLSDGGARASAAPLYHEFVLQALKLNPHYLTMIIPSRWFAGGKGLDSFRNRMINDRRITVLHDYLNAEDCFGTGVEIKSGVCYFLWDASANGKCKVFTHSPDGSVSYAERYMKRDGSDVFIRRNEAISILDKITSNGESFSCLVSSRKPFGLATTEVGHEEEREGDVVIYRHGGVAYYPRSQLPRNQDWVDKPKIFITKAYGASDDYPHQILNKPIVVGKATCCSETYLVIGPFETLSSARNVESYLKTRLFRFLVSIKKISQDATSRVYQFVPMQDFSHPWTDEMLYRKYGLDEREVAFIESTIRPME